MQFYNPVGSLVIGAKEVDDSSERALTLEGFGALVSKFPFFKGSCVENVAHRIDGSLVCRLDQDGGWINPRDHVVAHTKLAMQNGCDAHKMWQLLSSESMKMVCGLYIRVAHHHLFARERLPLPKACSGWELGL